VSISGIESVLVGVADIDAALELYRDRLGLKVEFDGSASLERLAFWGLDGSKSARLVELSCNGYAAGRLCLVAFDPPATTMVRVHVGDGPHDSATDIGPKAIDFYVEPPIDAPYRDIVDAGFIVRSPPILHEVGDTKSEEFVFWGPGGVPLLLMVGHRHTVEQMRGEFGAKGVSEVATISVVGESVEATRAFYGDVLGMELIQDNQTDPEYLELANELTGTPAGTPIHWLLYRGEAEPSGKILIVHFVGAPGVRLTGRMRPGHLGFSLMRHSTDQFGAVHEAAAARGSVDRVAVVEGVRTMLIRGPNEELFEVAERRP